MHHSHGWRPSFCSAVLAFRIVEGPAIGAMSSEPIATLRALAFELAAMTFPNGIPQSSEYLADVGVVTPKAGTAVAAFDDRARILLIRRADDGRWGLPGGYAEIGSPPSANAIRELHEETGFEAELQRILGVFDNRAFRSSSPYQFYVLLFRARLLRGEATPSPETTAVALFARSSRRRYRISSAR